MTSNISKSNEFEKVNTYVKFSSNRELNNNRNFRKAFNFDNARNTVDLNVKGKSINKFYADFIFNEYENTVLMFSKIKNELKESIKNSNQTFFCFGQNSLSKTKFLFGSHFYGNITTDSFFKYFIDLSCEVLKGSYEFIVFDVIGIKDEKFYLDFKNLTLDEKCNILEFLNGVTNDNNKEALSQFIITIKFLKIIPNKKGSEINQAEIVRSLSFIDLGGFDDKFSQYILNNQIGKKEEDLKFKSILNFKNLIESISDINIEKFTSLNSTLISVIIDILRTKNLSLTFFAFIDPSENSTIESLITLEIMNKFKKISLHLFFEALQELNTDISVFNRFTKEEFYLLDNIFSELINLLICMHNIEVFDSVNFLSNLNDLDQQEKFQYLNDYLNQIKFNFDVNKEVTNTFEIVNGFFLSRAKWQELVDLHENLAEIGIRLKRTNLSFRNLEINNIEVHNNDKIDNNTISQKSEKKDTVELNSIIRQLSEYYEPNNKKDKENSVFHYFSQDKNVKNKEKYLIQQESQKKEKIKSAESNFSQFLLKDYLKSLKGGFSCLFNRLNVDSSCLPCGDEESKIEFSHFTANVSKYKYLKESSKKLNSQQSSKPLKENDKDNLEINVKSTNIKTFQTKTQEETIKNKTDDIHNKDNKKSLIQLNNNNSFAFSNSHFDYNNSAININFDVDNDKKFDNQVDYSTITKRYIETKREEKLSRISEKINELKRKKIDISNDDLAGNDCNESLEKTEIKIFQKINFPFTNKKSDTRRSLSGNLFVQNFTPFLNNQRKEIKFETENQNNKAIIISDKRNFENRIKSQNDISKIQPKNFLIKNSFYSNK